MNTRKISFVLAAAAVIHPAAVLAQHAGDIGVRVEDGRITTGLFDDVTSTFTPGVRVFAAEFGEVAPNFTDEPGFDAVPGTFGTGTSVGFNLLKALRRWDGAAFSTIPSERVEFDFGPATAVATPLIDEFTPGFTLAVSPDGEWHNHLEQSLLAPASSGIYLVEMELFSTDPGVAQSLPFWIVYNQGAVEAEHDAAIEWVNTTLVPSPSALALGMVLSATVGRRRRR